MSPRFRTSPSTIARYFFLDCERFFRYRAEPGNPSLPRTVQDSSPVMAAILESGSVWEREVLGDYIQGKVHIAPGDGDVTGRYWTWEQSIELFKEALPGEYIFQPTLRVPERFYERYKLDHDQVHISDNRPDLIQVYEDEHGRRLLRVIDIKRGKSLKLTYRVQVLLYALELDTIVEEWGVDAQVDLERGAAWLGNTETPELFDFAGVRVHLERFLKDELPRILSQEASQVGWHLRFRCEWCEYFDHCRGKMVAEDNISRLAGLTTYGKRFLEREHEVRSLDELRAFLEREGADEELRRCASLVGQRPRLQAKLRAFAESSPVAVEAFHPGLPIGENIALFITLQEEPLGEHIYLVGLLVNGRAEVRRILFGEQGPAYPFVLTARQPEHARAICDALIDRLYEVLQRVDAWNQEKEWREQLTVQAYTFTEKERLLLIRILLDCVGNVAEDPVLARKAMVLLFHFQAPDLMLTEEHPTGPIAWPVITIASVLGRLAALPVDVSYTLPESLQALGSRLAYPRDDTYHFPLGHGMRPDPIHRFWTEAPDEVERMEPIRKEGALRLIAIRSMLRQIRAHFSDWIVHWPPRFRLLNHSMASDPLLSRLAFLTVFEGSLRCLAVRATRSESRETLRVLGQLIELEAISGEEFAVVGSAVEVEEDGFPNWLLVRDTVEGLQAQLAYPDYAHRKTPWSGSWSPHYGVVGITSVVQDALGYARSLTVSWRRGLRDDIAPGERFLLLPRYSDFISDKVIEFIQRLDQHREGIFADLLYAPQEVAAEIEVDAALGDEVGRALPHLGLTASQAVAWETILSRRVVAIWGPPGTGKTHFLASMVVGLALAHAALRRPFHVLVTAFTHAAIENLLAKIHERLSEVASSMELSLGKADGWRTQRQNVAETVSAKDAWKWLAKRRLAVLGGTVYACRKDETATFDLVLIDEASQLKVPEASIPVTRLKDEGRLVLAGDYLQLGPILAGTYPEPPEGMPVLHRSIFDLVRGDEHREGAPVCQLLENFRMNDVLTSLAARLLYGASYRCATEAIAARRLELGTVADELQATCLDPDYPLVIAILDGVIAAKENPVEAALVADLTLAIRDQLHGVTDDKQFFEHDLFIVSPHHAQIRAIRQELNARREWEAPPFVDTVDKMQGQEAQVVLVSYGVSDPEYAMREAEFIYGVNRLNVAITRAQKKCVLFLPKPLLEATPEVLDNEVASVGLAYMRHLVQLCEETGEDQEFKVAEGYTLRVLRMQAKVSVT